MKKTKMKKTTAVLCALMLAVALLFCGCANKTVRDDSKLNIVTTVFPIYDWVKNITDGAENVEITMLLDTGVDLHSFQPTADDIMTINTCDLFIYVGGASDAWVDDVLKNVADTVKAVDLMDVLGDMARDEEVVEGMQTDDDEGDESEADEHIWLSLRNASCLCRGICNALTEVDAENKALYESNLEAYTAKLDELDRKYIEATETDGQKVLLFGDRFPFLYLAKDYDIEYYAAFSGCSAESEASFETIAKLSGKVEELKLKYIMVLEGGNRSVAEQIAENVKSNGTADTGDITILALDSMQSVTKEDADNGETYIKVMEKDLEVLVQAFE